MYVLSDVMKFLYQYVALSVVIDFFVTQRLRHGSIKVIKLCRRETQIQCIQFIVTGYSKVFNRQVVHSPVGRTRPAVKRIEFDTHSG